MARVVDITEKLSFDENPRIMIKGEEFEVNSDAKTVLEIMGCISAKGEIQGSISAYEKMFSEKDRGKIEEMKLPFKDFMTLIESSMALIQGEDEVGGEQ